MKRSVGQKLPSRETRSKKSRHDLKAVEKTDPPTTNIFLVETVLRRLFKEIESVSMLKDLRRVCQLWDRVATEELEERAFKGQIKPINLTFFNQIFKPLKLIREELREFLDDTSSNPRLFRSFTIIFPCSLALLNLYKFRWFYKDYTPTTLQLDIPEDFRFNKVNEGLLEELLSWAAPTLRELIIPNNFARESDLIPSRKSFPVKPFKFHHLRKVSTKMYTSGGIVDTFKVIFTKDNHPETPSLASLRLECVNPVDLLDLNSNPSRWAILTKLDIECHAIHGTNRFSNGLLSLARAGLTLKKLNLGLRLVEDPHFLGTCSNLSEFFASQAGSLEALTLSIMIKLALNWNENIGEDQWGQIKIQLPVFERLHTLLLDLDIRVYINNIFTNNIFEFGSIPQHFPALENLNILKFGGSLDKFLKGSCGVMEERLNLKRISIPGGMFWKPEENSLRLDKYFGSVEAFACFFSFITPFPVGTLAKKLRILGDLVDTIRVLHIRDVTCDLDLSPFKALRRVVVEEDEKAKWKLIKHKGRYLGYFKKVAELGLDSIKFRGLEMVGDEYKEFAEAFPFRVEFEDKPMDWFDKDFNDD